MPALVGRDRHAVYVLLDRRVHDLPHRPVVSEVDHLGALGLEDPPHDVDRGVVPVEQGRSGDQSDGTRGTMQIIHGGPSRAGRGTLTKEIVGRPSKLLKVTTV